MCLICLCSTSGKVTHGATSFVGVVLLKWVDPALLLSFYAIACSAFALGVTYGPGKSGVGCMFALFFFESICYPVRQCSIPFTTPFWCAKRYA